MAYILQRTDQGGGYVAPSGSRSSYCRDPRNARLFDTVDEAERDRCPGNEVIRRYFSDTLGPVIQAPVTVRCIHCGEADNSKGEHGHGRCV